MSQSLVKTDLKLLEKKPATPESAIQFEPLLDARDAAALLGIHPKTLQKMARSGQVPGIRIGKCWAFRASVLDSWLKSKLAG